MKKIRKISKLFLESLIIFSCLFLLNNLFNYLELSEQKQGNEFDNTSVVNSEKEDDLLQNNNNINNENDNLRNMKVHYIDVEEGDSIFIELPNEKTMLIDAGEAVEGKKVINYIKQLGYSNIDYVVGTHPHTDHIGGLAQVINSFSVGKIYMPKVISTSKTYENLLNTISMKGLKIQTAKAGINIINDNNLLIDIIAPNNDSYSDLNNYSVVIKITYKNRKFIFMGDAEMISENEILTDVTADIVKVGHHGSNTSSGQNFVDRVNAKYAIISVGSDNNYNHPNMNIVNRWENSGAKVYRTDLSGTIIAITDGNALSIETEK